MAAFFTRRQRGKLGFTLGVRDFPFKGNKKFDNKLIAVFLFASNKSFYIHAYTNFCNSFL